MKKIYEFQIGKLNVSLGVTNENKLRMLHYSILPFPNYDEIEEQLLVDSNLLEIQITGYNQPNHKGNKLSNTYIGKNLEFVDITQSDRLIRIEQKYTDSEIQMVVITKLEEYPESNALVWSSEVINKGDSSFGMEFVTSANITNLNQGDKFQRYDEQILYLPHNAWTGELQWERTTLKEKGLDFSLDGEKLQDSTKVVEITNNSSWSCAQYNPSGILYNEKLNISTFWQIDSNGEWHWEITDCGMGKYLALRLFGPTESTNHWWKSLQPKEVFNTIPVLCGCTYGEFDESIKGLTNYRRSIRRSSIDNEKCPVIFNDYMNCLMGDPTYEKEIPLINRAAEIGCEYYVIDCGWYSDGYWWDNVGEWKESSARFPNGITQLTDYIASKGMVPGLWLEIEVMGINSELANSLPDNWFFCRHGKRVKDHSRYHLDFRNTDVQEYASSVVKRLIEDYKIGYIKMDYNTATGIGSDLDTDSFSDALLEHNRAYLNWIDRIFEEYPDLVIENCGSGGMRHDYQMLKRHSIQSVTDQTDYLRNGAIAAICASGITPEQSAIWSYPLSEGDDEEVIFNMINALLLRVHQSGHLAKLNQNRLDLVKEAIDVYKRIRTFIPNSHAFWPTGIPHIDDEWFTLGLDTADGKYLAVWRTVSTNSQLSICLKDEIASVEQLYPLRDDKTNFYFTNHQLLVEFSQDKMARIYKIS